MTPYQMVRERYSFPFELRPYQIDSVDNKLCPYRRAGLYDEPGTGKTATATFFSLYWHMMEGTAPYIVLLPPILLTQWERWLASIKDLKTGKPLTSAMYAGTPAQRKKVDLNRDYILTTYGLLKNDYEYLYDRLNPLNYGVLADEAHVIKNIESQTHKAVNLAPVDGAHDGADFGIPGQQQAHRVGPLGLQPPLHTLFGGKAAQALEVGRRERLQVAQHHGGHRIATGQLNLRKGVARVHGSDQRAQRQQHAAHMLGQHRANAHVGHVAALALVKTHQHLAFFHHVAHRKPGTVTVAPGGTFNRPQNGFRLDLAQMPKVVFQHPLLDGHLGGGVKMLHLAAPTGALMQTEVWAAGPYALGRFDVDSRQTGLFPVVFASVRMGTDLLERQRALNEHHLAIGPAGDALGI